MAGTSTTKTDKAVNDIEAFFERQALRTAKGWRPEPETTFEGEVVGLRMGESDYRSADRPDGRYPIVVYKVHRMFKRDGSPMEHTDTVALHVFHKVLTERLMELGTDIGSRQFITYIGEVEGNTVDTKTGEKQKYHMYDAENVGTESAGGKEEGFSFGS